MKASVLSNQHNPHKEFNADFTDLINYRKENYSQFDRDQIEKEKDQEHIDLYWFIQKVNYE